MAVLQRTQAPKSVLLTAPTGSGKALAGFLPSLWGLIESEGAAKVHPLFSSRLIVYYGILKSP